MAGASSGAGTRKSKRASMATGVASRRASRSRYRSNATRARRWYSSRTTGVASPVEESSQTRSNRSARASTVPGSSAAPSRRACDPATDIRLEHLVHARPEGEVGVLRRAEQVEVAEREAERAAAVLGERRVALLLPEEVRVAGRGCDVHGRRERRVDETQEVRAERGTRGRVRPRVVEQREQAEDVAGAAHGPVRRTDGVGQAKSGQAGGAVERLGQGRPSCVAEEDVRRRGPAEEVVRVEGPRDGCGGIDLRGGRPRRGFAAGRRGRRRGRPRWRRRAAPAPASGRRTGGGAPRRSRTRAPAAGAGARPGWAATRPACQAARPRRPAG